METLAWTTLQETNAEHLWSGSRWQKAGAGDSLSILQKPWKLGNFQVCLSPQIHRQVSIIHPRNLT